MPHVINCRALTGEKPCINKAILALLMHDYATFNMPVPGPHNCCRHEMCSARPLNEDSPWKLRSRDISERAKQNTVKPVLVVTSIKQPTCIKQPEERCPKIHILIYLNCIKQPPAFSSHILSFPWVAA